MSLHGDLGLPEAISLAGVVRAAQGNLPVARLVGGDVVHGTARSITCQDRDDDVRDCWLDVQLAGGGWAAWGVGELLEESPTGAFLVGAEPEEEAR